MEYLRETPRIEINHPVSCTCLDGNDNFSPPCDGMLINISMKGALIETKKPLEAKWVLLGNNCQNNPLLVKGKIVHLSKAHSPNDNLFGMFRTGIQFTDLPENSKAFIVSIIKPEEKSAKGLSPIVTDLVSDAMEANTMDFEAETINLIINENNGVNDDSRLMELLYDEAADNNDDDVLETIGKLLEEKEPQASAVPEIKKVSIPKKKPGNKNIKDSHREIAKKSDFLLYFNAGSFFILCLILTTCILFFIINHFSKIKPGFSFGKIIELPFFSKNNPEFNHLIRELALYSPKKISFLRHSIKSHFKESNSSGRELIIKGLIRAESQAPQEKIKITGRLFTKKNTLFKKTSVFVEMPLKQTDQGGETVSIPFQLSFPAPPMELSKFSLDIER